jgi:transposase
MTSGIWNLVEKSIDQAYVDKDSNLLEKEMIFILNNYAMNMSEVYADVIQYVKPVKVSMKTTPNFTFEEEYIANLKKVLNYSERIMQRNLELTEAKMFLDEWFYNVTETGILIFSYNDVELVNIAEAAKILGVSRPTVYKYIERGLETVGNKNNQRVPRFLIEAWKNPTFAFQMQWSFQMKRAREQTLDQRLSRINKQIEDFEMEYGSSYYLLFEQMTKEEMDAHAESVDIYDWRELELEKQKILSRIVRSETKTDD